MIEVTPAFSTFRAFHAARKAAHSGPPYMSISSAVRPSPYDRCTCASMRPGMMVNPRASTTRSGGPCTSLGRSAPCQIAEMRPFLMRSELRGRGGAPVQSSRVPSRMSTIVPTLMRSPRRGLDRMPTSPGRAPSTPYLPRHLHDAGELCSLSVDRHDAGVDVAGKAALRAQGELLQRQVARRLVDPPFELVLALEQAALRREKAEDDGLLGGDEAQWLEAPRAGAVVFEQIPVRLDLVEQRFRDGIVTTLGQPGGTEIAATEMDADGHIRRPRRDRAVDELRIAVHQAHWVFADAPNPFSDALVAQERDVDLVDLQVTTARVGQVADLLTVDPREIGIERIHLRISVAIDGVAAAAEMERARRGYRELGGGLGHRLQ